MGAANLLKGAHLYDAFTYISANLALHTTCTAEMQLFWRNPLPNCTKGSDGDCLCISKWGPQHLAHRGPAEGVVGAAEGQSVSPSIFE